MRGLFSCNCLLFYGRFGIGCTVISCWERGRRLICSKSGSQQFQFAEYCVILDVSFMLPISSVAEGEGTCRVGGFLLGTDSGHDSSSVGYESSGPSMP